MTAKRIGLNFARTFAGKIWSNPLCCHSLPVTKQRGLNQILPGHSQARLGPILCAVISYRCHSVYYVYHHVLSLINPPISEVGLS